MDSRALGNGGLRVSALGLGCMPMSHGYGSAASRDPAEALATLDAALGLGISFFDTAEVYGPHSNEELLGRFRAGRRDALVIATKFGFRIGAEGKIAGLDGTPGQRAPGLRGLAAAARRRLHRPLLPAPRSTRTCRSRRRSARWPNWSRPARCATSACRRSVRRTLRRAAAVHPIAALQSEYSLWERGVEREVLPACRELGIGLVPYAPLGRGFLADNVPRAEEFQANGDFRAILPRFQAENWEQNRALGAALTRFAHKQGMMPAQLALAWLLAQGPDIVPIPGTRRRTHLAENAAATRITLPSCDLMALEEMFPRGVAVGARYQPEQQAWTNR